MTERVPGEVQVPANATVMLNPGRERIELTVENDGDRPIQVGSHYHFAAANPALTFDRQAAWGRRLDIPAGTSVRFEPGLSKVVGLVPIGGSRVIPGLRPEYAGPLDTTTPPAAPPQEALPPASGKGGGRHG